MILNANVYDPEEEEGRRRPSHVTKKEVLIIAGSLIILVILFYPVFRRFHRKVDSDRCILNLNAIKDAIPLYAADNNDRLPPVYMVSEVAQVPKVTSNGKEFTWVSLISRYMPTRASFKCPGASDEENVLNEGMQEGQPPGTPLVSSYGMFGALSAFPIGSIPSPDSTALIADSSSQGANNTYDPLPFRDPAGKAVPDGIVIGFDDTNFTAGDSTRVLYQHAKYATRLAFPGSSKGVFDPLGACRHTDGKDDCIHMLMVDGHLKRFRAPAAKIHHAGKNGDPAGLWYVPY